jgi:hypothetical protein
MQDLKLSPVHRYALFALGGLVLIVGGYTLGLCIGERKARHFSEWCDNYGAMFEMPMHRRPPFPFASIGTPSSHGVFGKIITVSGNEFIIQGRDDIEQHVIITSSTAIRRGKDQGGLQDLLLEGTAAVFGVPTSSGAIEARLIRLLDQPQDIPQQ